jgi:alpha-L-rhamnosidase
MRMCIALVLLVSLQVSKRLCEAQSDTHSGDSPFSVQAHWITSTPAHESLQDGAGDEATLPIFRHGFPVHKQVVGALLHISGLGQYEAHINGQNVTDAVLTPGWTDYRKRVLFDTYDVKHLLLPGSNVIGVMLGRGMYDVEATKGRYTKFTRSFGRPTLIAQLDIRYADGTTDTIVSDDAWQVSPGPITFSSPYGGEDYDARLEMAGWDTPHFNASAWKHATMAEGPGGQLKPELIPPVKAVQQFNPVAITHPAPNKTVYDLGQNFSGWPDIEVSGPRGTKVTMIAGELLDSNGFVTQHSANASPQNENAFTYILKGDGDERWHPRFSYWGFRYVQVNTTGAVMHHLRGDFLHDAVMVDGSFTSSDELFNRIHKLINMAMLSNMFSVLTDCPHREKLGWLEQTHLAGASLMYNYDLSKLYEKMADDMQDAQLANGLVPDIAPEFPVFEGPFRDSPEWGIADILSTWTAYQFYGNRDVLKDHYASMVKYLTYLQGKTQNHLLLYGLGDWYDIGPGEPGQSKLTAKGLTATAVYYQALTHMARIAALTGHDEDRAAYEAEAKAVRSAFNARYFNPATRQYDRGSQTANAMPLVVGLVPDEARDAVLANLVADIRSHENHVTAGDIGYHYVVRALTDGNRSDVLYDMLSRTDKPSYGDQLAHGATSLTEAWDANPNSSQNHFMLGHAEEWFYRGLAGIHFDLDQSPDQQIMIQPAIVGQITNVKATFHSRLGDIESEWTRQGKELRMTIVVPAGAKATVVFPLAFRHAKRLDGRPFGRGAPVSGCILSDSHSLCVVNAGRHVFLLSQ